MGFHSSVLLQFCQLVIFSQIWVVSGPLLCLEYRDLKKTPSSVIYVRADCSAVMTSLCICQDSVRVSSRLGLSLPASLSINNTQAVMKINSTNCAPLSQCGYCSSHFTRVRVSSYFFSSLSIGAGLVMACLGKWSSWDCSDCMTCLGTWCFVNISLLCIWMSFVCNGSVYLFKLNSTQ